MSVVRSPYGTGIFSLYAGVVARIDGGSLGAAVLRPYTWGSQVLRD
jgi:hypothetical protein